MKLIDLWDALLEKASDIEKEAAMEFHAVIAKLHDDLELAGKPEEYPKWVMGKLAADAEHEARIIADQSGAARAVVVTAPSVEVATPTVVVTDPAVEVEEPVEVAATDAVTAPAGSALP